MLEGWDVEKVEVEGLETVMEMLEGRWKLASKLLFSCSLIVDF